jgi:hypothetical protein
MGTIRRRLQTSMDNRNYTTTTSVARKEPSKS